MFATLYRWHSKAFARECIEIAQDRLRSCTRPEPSELARALWNIGFHWYEEGDLRRAHRYINRSYDLALQIGDTRVLMGALDAQLLIANSLGECRRSRLIFAESGGVLRGLGFLSQLYVVMRVGEACVYSGAHEEALQAVARCRELERVCPPGRPVPAYTWIEALLQLLYPTEFTCRPIDEPMAPQVFRPRAACITFADGHVDEAERFIREAVTELGPSSFSPMLAWLQGRVHLERGEYRQAALAFKLADRSKGTLFFRARACRELVELSQLKPEVIHIDPAPYLKRARQWFTKMENQLELTQVDRLERAVRQDGDRSASNLAKMG
jgi:tetratricopeptide (TPR) repeat protein